MRLEQTHSVCPEVFRGLVLFSREQEALYHVTVCCCCRVEELDELANSLRNMSHNLSDAAEQTNLLSSAQSFCQSFTDLLKAAEEQSNDTVCINITVYWFLCRHIKQREMSGAELHTRGF